MLVKLDSQVEKNAHSLHKMNFMYIQDLYVRTQTVHYGKKDTEMLHNMGLGNNILHKISKVQAM